MITRHTRGTQPEALNYFYDSFSSRFANAIPALQKDVYSKSMSGVYKDVANGLCHSIVLGKESITVAGYFRYALQLGIGNFKLALNPEIPVEITLGASTTVATGKANPQYLDVGTWLFLCQLALITRDAQAYEYLGSISIQEINTSTITHDAIDFSMALLFGSLGDPTKVREALSKVLDTIRTEREQFENRYTFNLHVTNPQVDVIAAIVSKDQVAFDSALETALNLHRTYYDTDRPGFGRPGDPFSWISFGLLAICRLALDHGLEIRIESDYIPRWLLGFDFHAVELPF